MRRAIATSMGAHVVLDPGQADGRQAGFDQAIEAWSADADDDNPPVVFDV